MMTRVVMVSHSDGEVTLYAVVEGETSKCVKQLIETCRQP